MAFFRKTFRFDIVIQRTGQRGPEAGQVGTAIPLGNVVGVAEDVLCEGIVPLHRHFDGTCRLPSVGSGRPGSERSCFCSGGDEGFQTTFVLEQLLFAATLVHQADSHAGVEEAQLTQAFRQDIVVEFDIGKRLGRRAKMHAGTAFFRFAHHVQRRSRHAVMIDLLVDLPWRQMVSFSSSDSALTTDTPTPCKPPETL